MAQELLDIVDEDNKLLGIKKSKVEAHEKGLWHRNAHIWIYNSKGEVLLQLRAKDKIFLPNMWDISVAGHVSSGEEPVISALREIEEEIGLCVKKEDLKFWRIEKIDTEFKELKNKEFCYVYFLRFEGEINKLKVQEEELKEIKFIPLKELEKDLKSNPEKYTPLGKYWFDVLEEIKKRI